MHETETRATISSSPEPQTLDPRTHTCDMSAGVRPVPLEIHIQGFDITNLDSRMQAMARPCYSALTTHAGQKPAIVFVPSKRHARQTAVDLWAYASADGKGDKFLQVNSVLLFVVFLLLLFCCFMHIWC